MNQIFYSWQQFDRDVVKLAREIWMSNWQPDYIVGISRGGLPLATSLSNYMNIPMKPLLVSLRDHVDTVSDLSMADDAGNGVNILICDDINDSGATFNWIVDDWQSSNTPSNWNQIWNITTRFATLWDNPASKSKYSMYYTINEKNPDEDPWIVFPWEQPFTGEK